MSLIHQQSFVSCELIGHICVLLENMVIPLKCQCVIKSKEIHHKVAQKYAQEDNFYCQTPLFKCQGLGSTFVHITNLSLRYDLDLSQVLHESKIKQGTWNDLIIYCYI